MMWLLLIWILAVMRGRLHEYSEALSLRERWMLKVTLEGNRGRGSRADCAFKSASTISKITVKYLRIKAKLIEGPLLIYAVNSGLHICMSLPKPFRASKGRYQSGTTGV